MRITNTHLLEISRAIATLDAGSLVTVDGKTTSRPFKYGAPVHFALQRNAAALKPHAEAFDKANKALFAQYAEPFTNDKGEPAQRVPAAKLKEYQAEVAALLALPITVKLFQIKLTDLKVGSGDGENPIAAQTIVDLGRTLLDDAAKELIEVLDDTTATTAAEG